MADKEQDQKLREMAANRGCRLVKSRRRKPGGDFGRYGLADPKTGKQLFGFGGGGLEASAEEIEDFLRGRAESTWKSSIAASGKAPKGEKPAPRVEAPPKTSKPRNVPDKRPAAKVEMPERASPPAHPPQLRIRAADSVDSEAIAPLLVELGYEVTAEDVAERLQRLARSGEPALLAKQGGAALGCLTWHVTPNIHRPAPVGRITMLVVTAKARRRGIGRALIEAAQERLAERGCGLVEVTSNVKLRAAHRFYESLGFEKTSHRFAKPLKG